MVNDLRRSASPAADVHAALAAVARAIADSLEVRQVWDRVFAACALIVPFDALGIMRLEANGGVRTMAAAGLHPGVKRLEGAVFPRNQYSATLWPDTEDFFVLVRDAEKELDTSFLADRVVVSSGYRSVLRLPLRHGGKIWGALTLCTRERACYGFEHGPALRLICDLIAVTVAREQLASALADDRRHLAAAEARAVALERRVEALSAEVESSNRTVGSSRRWRDVVDTAIKVAPSDAAVLLAGEPGTGKTVVARFIHKASARREGPFVALRCAVLGEEQLELELFGRERGLPGDASARPGKIEQAARGTLFFDEIAAMSLAVQAQVLRVLQDRTFERIDGSKAVTADVRVIASTSRDLRAAVDRGTFREDLFYRLAVLDIPLPPLREHAEDLPMLTDALLGSIARSLGRPALGITEIARRKLADYAWPGNVSELRNVLERAAMLCENGVIDGRHVSL